MAPKGDGGDKAAASAGDVELATKGDAPDPEDSGSVELVKKPADDHKEEYGLLHLAFCFFGIMGAFVCYGMVMEYATSGGNKLHEFSLIIVTSSFYTLVAMLGQHLAAEPATNVPKAHLGVLALLSVCSTFTSVRSLRYVIFPVQVLAKSCKPIPIMIVKALQGEIPPTKKWLNVGIIVLGVAIFMGCGDKNKGGDDADKQGPMMYFGVLLLFISLCFDGGAGVYADHMMGKQKVPKFTMMYNTHIGKVILAFIFLLAFNEINYFFLMCQETGPVLFLLGFTGAIGQCFIFETISTHGSLQCSIIGLARKIFSIVASIILFGHRLNAVQTFGLMMSIAAMTFDLAEKSKKGGKKGGHKPPPGPKKHLEMEDQEAAKKDEIKGLLDERPDPEEEQDAFEDTRSVERMPLDRKTSVMAFN